MSVNQAVIFTKPLHHLGIGLTPEELDAQARTFLESKGFNIIRSKPVTGSGLEAQNVIRQHYILYSTAAWADEFTISDEGKTRFDAAFGKSWEEELSVGKIIPTAELLARKKINADQLFAYWNSIFGSGKTAKIDDGFIMGFIEELDAYCVNGFYPSMEANFYHPETRMTYYVVEFDPADVSWADFRKQILGSTNAAGAAPESFRGKLYADYPVEFPGRDNFVHGSAGPVEGLVERAIHEADFNLSENPVGKWLAERGVTLGEFKAWKDNQSVTALGDLFDETEEKNTDEIVQTLEKIKWD